MILLELLEELKEVDAKAYEEHFKLVERTRYDFWPVWVADPITGEYSPESGIIFNSIIQASIQRACERRGDWEVSVWWKDNKWVALIRLPGGYTDPHKVFAEESDSAAEALLAAYIAAVRAEAKR